MKSPEVRVASCLSSMMLELILQSKQSRPAIRSLRLSTSLPVPVEVIGEPYLGIISVDYLPSMLPREASETSSKDLLPSVLQLKDWGNVPM